MTAMGTITPASAADTSGAKISGALEVPRRGRPRDARCDHAILQATLDLLTEGGAGGLSIDGVAARAGVGKATIYRRWSSKEALLLEALGTDTSVMPNPDTGTLRGDVEQYFAVMLDKLHQNQRSDVLPHLIEAAFFDPEVKQSLDQYLSHRQEPLRVILQRAQLRGEISAATDLKVLSDTLVGPIIYRRLLTQGRLDRAFVRKLLDIVLQPLQPHQPHSSASVFVP
jgi:AcrR family transcriptional regulator